MKIDQKNIWMFEQNKPSLIVKDIVEKYPDVDPDFVYEVLLKRGAFKWFAARRDIIKLKNKWRDEIRELNDYKKPDKEKGFFNALIKCRQEVRKICHSQRFRAPDHDEKSLRYLQKISS